MKNNKFYITTPIYYVNDRPHIGHAYTTVLADVLARQQEKQGKDVFFLTGTDEHGAKISQAAKKAGKSEKNFVDEKAASFVEVWKKLNIENSNFIRTTESAHVEAVKKAVQRLFDKGFIYKGDYDGLYCTGCEQYKNSEDLIDGKCPEHQIEPQMMKEESYFFKLSQFQNVLKEKIEKGELEILPQERKNEILSFFGQELKDISISRAAVNWGIPLPFDEKFTIYVWIDAFFNYLTGLGWNGDQLIGSSVRQFKTEEPKGREASENDKLVFFPPDLQLMSKDILRVHATIWPALLLALELPLPKKIYVHGYFTIDGQKMSKSLGNVIWPEELVEKFGVDGARYLLMSSLAFGQDGDISWEKLTEKYNSDLANGLGNLISRVVKLNENIKAQAEENESSGKANGLLVEIKPKEALDEIWKRIAYANKKVEEAKLWEFIKTDAEEAKKVLSELLGLIFEVSKEVAPFMPQTCGKIVEILESGKAEILFPRIK
ncbi:MAG: methionine--tRNA ligase [Candidatus Portnoybacteria bacterium]|nr:methionine--tRNA ligase [Candidatus Portnoybacteria bacterium]